ncbi:hypothetical protein SLEP1_g45273 [Rubroshorea leprosula]|uniref:Uncharacterized protein n=1 Tax=Rubroshorea leprosula TaxID=152421 RepID=A0AAV5LIN5_9ROSI|nr:hypothetical protein SLEP1_g45273 [Rubroshorea leprosula]
MDSSKDVQLGRGNQDNWEEGVISISPIIMVVLPKQQDRPNVDAPLEFNSSPSFSSKETKTISEGGGGKGEIETLGTNEEEENGGPQCRKLGRCAPSCQLGGWIPMYLEDFKASLRLPLLGMVFDVLKKWLEVWTNSMNKLNVNKVGTGVPLHNERFWDNLRDHLILTSHQQQCSQLVDLVPGTREWRGYRGTSLFLTTGERLLATVWEQRCHDEDDGSSLWEKESCLQGSKMANQVATIESKVDELTNQMSKLKEELEKALDKKESELDAFLEAAVIAIMNSTINIYNETTINVKWSINEENAPLFPPTLLDEGEECYPSIGYTNWVVRMPNLGARTSSFPLSSHPPTLIDVPTALVLPVDLKDNQVMDKVRANPGAGFIAEPRSWVRLGSSRNPGEGFVMNPRLVQDEPSSWLLGSATNPAPGFVSEPRGGVCDEPVPGSRRTKLLGSSQSPIVGFVVNPSAGFVSKPKCGVRREPSFWVRLRTEAKGIFGLGGKKMRKNTVSIFGLFL